MLFSIVAVFFFVFTMYAFAFRWFKIVVTVTHDTKAFCFVFCAFEIGESAFHDDYFSLCCSKVSDPFNHWVLVFMQITNRDCSLTAKEI